MSSDGHLPPLLLWPLALGLGAALLLWWLTRLAPPPPRPIPPGSLWHGHAGAQAEPAEALIRLHDEPTCRLSIIVPAYNEALRLPVMLSEVSRVLQSPPTTSPSSHHNPRLLDCEIIVVDDGSNDDTASVAQKCTPLAVGERMRVLRLPRNLGKGAAVRAGMAAACGRLLLFADADGATRFDDVHLLLSELCQNKLNTNTLMTTTGSLSGEGAGASPGAAIAIGSRAHLRAAHPVKRSRIRKLLMAALHCIVGVLGIHGIRDTQCGFKMFTREAARHIFAIQRVSGWIFDIEVLLLAQWLGLPIVEIDVSWSEISGSKLQIATDSVRMLWDLLRLRWNYATGAWRIPSHAGHQGTIRAPS